MIYKKNVIVLSDAYSTGRFLPPAFMAHGIDCIHIRTSRTIPALYGNTYRPDDFVLELTHDEFEAAPDTLGDLNPLIVLPGAESGVELAEKIAHSLDLNRKNPEGTAHRCRDKFVMQSVIAKAGLPHIKQTRADNVEDAVTWANGQATYPVVLKPIDSSSSDNVHVCTNETEVHLAFAQILGAQTTIGATNEKVLVQRYLGESDRAHSTASVAYNINTVSCNGLHFVANIVRVHKKHISGSFVHDYLELICPADEPDLFAVLETYCHSVLSAIGFEYGISHSEVIFDNGVPTLIEIAGRPAGGADPSVEAICLGYTEFSIIASALFNPDWFARLIDQKRQPLRNRSACVFLINDRNISIGTEKNIDFWRSRLQSLHSITIKDREKIGVTQDLRGSPGNICLVSDNKASIDTDRDRIRDLERAYLESIRQ